MDTVMSGSSEEPFEITLIDADGDPLDTFTLLVESSATQIVNGFDNQTVSDGELIPDGDTMAECTKCDSYFDIKCMIFNYKCGIEELIYSVLLGLIVVTTIVVCARYCLPCKMVKFCCKGCCKKEKDEDKENEIN